MERSSWEEIPVTLVDLKRTESEIAGRKAALAEEAKVLSAEDKAERELQKKFTKNTPEPGSVFLSRRTQERIEDDQNGGIASQGE